MNTLNQTIENMAVVMVERLRSGLDTTEQSLMHHGFTSVDIKTFGQRAVVRASEKAAAEGMTEQWLALSQRSYTKGAVQ